MRKYRSLAVVVLSSGGALVAAAGAASAATPTDNWRSSPWLSSRPLAMHAAPFAHHDDDDALCGVQKADYRIGKIEAKLAQKGCISSGDRDHMPAVPGPPPVGSPHPHPCPSTCAPTPSSPWTPPTHPALNPCPPAEHHGRAASPAEATQVPAEGNTTAGLPIIGKSLGGQL